MRDARCEMRDARCEMRDARCEMRDARCEMRAILLWNIKNSNKKRQNRRRYAYMARFIGSYFLKFAAKAPPTSDTHHTL